MAAGNSSITESSLGEFQGEWGELRGGWVENEEFRGEIESCEVILEASW